MTFIDIITDKTNIDIVVSDAKGDQEARDDLRIGLGSVQKRDHVVAGIVGSEDKPPTSAPRDRCSVIIPNNVSTLCVIDTAMSRRSCTCCGGCL